MNSNNSSTWLIIFTCIFLFSELSDSLIVIFQTVLDRFLSFIDASVENLEVQTPFGVELNFVLGLTDDGVQFRHSSLVLSQLRKQIFIKLLMVCDQMVQLFVLKLEKAPLFVRHDEFCDFILRKLLGTISRSDWNVGAASLG